MPPHSTCNPCKAAVGMRSPLCSPMCPREAPSSPGQCAPSGPWITTCPWRLSGNADLTDRSCLSLNVSHAVPGVHLNHLRAGAAVVHRPSDVRGGSIEVLSARVHWKAIKDNDHGTICRRKPSRNATQISNPHTWQLLKQCSWWVHLVDSEVYKMTSTLCMGGRVAVVLQRQTDVKIREEISNAWGNTRETKRKRKPHFPPLGDKSSTTTRYTDI